jgi:hypothetical protein
MGNGKYFANNLKYIELALAPYIIYWLRWPTLGVGQLAVQNINSKLRRQSEIYQKQSTNLHNQ